jgi:hypothetical protein
MAREKVTTLASAACISILMPVAWLGTVYSVIDIALRLGRGLNRAGYQSPKEDGLTGLYGRILVYC